MSKARNLADFISNPTVEATEIANGAVTSAKLSYPLTTFSSTGIDDNATSTAITINSTGNVDIGGGDVHVSTLNTFLTLGPTLNSSGTGTGIGIRGSTPRMYFEPTADGQQARIIFANTGGTSWGSIFAYNDAERIQITANTVNFNATQVGIGETSPGGLLHLKSDDNGIIFQSSSSTNQRAQIFFQNSSGTTTGKIALDPDGGSANVMAFSTGSSERMRIDASGNVGVGTSSPDGVFHVRTTEASTGVTDPVVRFERLTTGDNAYLDITIDNANNLIGFQSTGTSDGDFTFGGAASEKVRITAGGRVGIGNTNPISAIHIFDQNNSSNMRRVAIESTSNAGANGGYRLVLNSANGTQRAGGYYFVPGNTDATTYIGLSSTDQDYALVATRENKIGIGVTTPTTKLQVDGDTNITGPYAIGTHNYYKQNWWFGGSTDLNWKKIADVTLTTGAYAAAAFLVKYTDPNTNFGSTSIIDEETYVVSCRRSAATQDDFNDALVAGPRNDRVRAVKTSTGVYEIQVRQYVNYRHISIEIQALSELKATITYAGNSLSNGSTTGTNYVPESTALRGAQRDGASSRGLYTFSSNTGVEVLRFDGDGLSFDSGSNHLDDYEEGTWTPTSTTYSGTMTIYNARYTKIGQHVTVHGYFRWPSNNQNNNSNQFFLGGLPFTLAAAGHYSAGTIGYTGGVDMEDAYLLGLVNSTSFYFTKTTPSSNFTNAEIHTRGLGGQFIFSMSYITDA